MQWWKDSICNTQKRYEKVGLIRKLLHLSKRMSILWNIKSKLKTYVSKLINIGWKIIRDIGQLLHLHFRRIHNHLIAMLNRVNVIPKASFSDSFNIWN